MLRRDYFIKQVEEFGKVLAQIIHLKRNGLFPDMQTEIDKAMNTYTSLEVKAVEAMADGSFVEDLTGKHQLTDEQLKFMGDLLFEKAEYYANISADDAGSANCYRKACLLYRFLKEHATLNYSLDMHYKLELLGRMGF